MAVAIPETPEKRKDEKIAQIYFGFFVPLLCRCVAHQKTCAAPILFAVSFGTFSFFSFFSGPLFVSPSRDSILDAGCFWCVACGLLWWYAVLRVSSCWLAGGVFWCAQTTERCPQMDMELTHFTIFTFCTCPPRNWGGTASRHLNWIKISLAQMNEKHRFRSPPPPVRLWPGT